MIRVESSLTNIVCAVGLFAMAGAGLSATANAAEAGPDERERIMEEITKRLTDDDAHQAGMQAGEMRSTLCASCHGTDGNSVRPGIPNLAEQNTIYLIQQISKFVDGRRKHFVMAALAKNFTFQDKINLAVYYSAQTLKPGEGDKSLAAGGKPIYEKVCIGCHGVDGRGQAGYALIARQKVDYVMTTLTRYRDNAKKRKRGEETQRSDLLMEKTTANLSDKDIEALSHYIALLGDSGAQ